MKIKLTPIETLTPTRFDLVPLVIPPDEWRRIEAGLMQRAHLLNRILGDFYGPQTLVRDGVLAPSQTVTCVMPATEATGAHTKSVTVVSVAFAQS